MQYALIFNETEQAFANRENDQQATYWSAWGAFAQALQEAEVFRGGNALLPPGTGTTVRMVDGERQVQDGPFAEAKEFLGGYMIIDVPDLDSAMTWAARCPAAKDGSVEVRPIRQMSE